MRRLKGDPDCTFIGVGVGLGSSDTSNQEGQLKNSGGPTPCKNRKSAANLKLSNDFISDLDVA